MIIKKGDSFYCKKTVLMEDGVVAYFKGKIYSSQNDECITDEDGEMYHIWDSEIEFNKYFEKMKP